MVLLEMGSLSGGFVVLVLLVFWAEVVLEDVDMVRRFRTDNGLEFFRRLLIFQVYYRLSNRC